jgi:hypothetical protein
MELIGLLLIVGNICYALRDTPERKAKRRAKFYKRCFPGTSIRGGSGGVGPCG